MHQNAQQPGSRIPHSLLETTRMSQAGALTLWRESIGESPPRLIGAKPRFSASSPISAAASSSSLNERM